ncbi:MAG: hypothetical protein MZV70_35630, partial [Desulfobacterales bacterium]|nr:hypothetical protein [Desulfobacterales bacterium]
EGWVRTKREAKNAVFLELNDGSCMANLQCVFDAATGLPDPLRAELALCGTGASVGCRPEPWCPAPRRARRWS